MKYNQKLPQKVEKDLDAYIERIKNIKWFQPASDLKRETVDTAVNAALEAFGVKASIEYRSLKTSEDYCAAWDAARGVARGVARGAARDAAWDAAWGVADILATHTDTYKLKTPFVRLVDIWEMGMYPCGVIDGKFVVYTPIDFEEIMDTNIPLNKTTILAEFDEKFSVGSFTWNGDNKTGLDSAKNTKRKVNHLISTSIDSLLKSLEEKCEDKKQMIPPFVSDSPESMTIQEVTMRTAYNEALQDIKSSIKSLYL